MTDTLRIRTKPYPTAAIDLRRMWINQPSTSQPYHHLHGIDVLAVRESGHTFRCYFLSGPIISQQVPGMCLSDGWNCDGRHS